MAVLYTQHFVQFFDNDGNPLSNGKLYAYSAGTTTPKATFTTEEATVENSNPIILDGSGRATVFISGAYRFDLFDQNDVLIKSTDDVNSFNALNDAGDPFFQSFSGNGSQTVFTLTESLGNDSKDIMVFVNNATGDVGYDIKNPSDYTLSGTSLTFDTAPVSGTNNIYVFAPTKLLGAASASAAAAAASEGAAAASASEAQAAAGLLDITSTTSLAIGTGSKVFTVATDLGLSAGQFVLATSDADVTNYMYGQITSYSTSSLTVNVLAIGGGGTYADWTIKLIGLKGDTGAAGGIAGGTLTGNIDGNSTYKLINMIDATNPQDYVTKAQLDAATAGGAEIALVTGVGYGSVGNRVVRFSTIETNNGGSDLTLTQSASNGDSVEINTTGIYSVTVEMEMTADAREYGITKNSSDLTANITALAVAEQVCTNSCRVSGNQLRTNASRTLNLSDGDVLRVQTDGQAIGTGAGDCRFSIIRIA